MKYTVAKKFTRKSFTKLPLTQFIMNVTISGWYESVLTNYLEYKGKIIFTDLLASL